MAAKGFRHPALRLNTAERKCSALVFPIRKAQELAKEQDIRVALTDLSCSIVTFGRWQPGSQIDCPAFLCLTQDFWQLASKVLHRHWYRAKSGAPLGVQCGG